MEMTLLLRARSTDGKWNGTILAKQDTNDSHPNLLYGSSIDKKSIGTRERKRMKDGRSIEFLWRTDPLEERVIPEFLIEGEANTYKVGGGLPTWTKWQATMKGDHEIYKDFCCGMLRITAPMELVGQNEWHDIIVRFNGPKLQLFIDGIMIDEEFPHGALRHFESPFLIGAGIVNGNVVSDFRGQIDHLAVWNRALSDSEIALLSGKEQHIEKRRDEIEGRLINIPQYWRPQGYNLFVGDPMVFFDNGRFHFFYLEG
jgi:hypothetical protein